MLKWYIRHLSKEYFRSPNLGKNTGIAMLMRFINSLDPSTQIRLIRMLNDLKRERTVTVLVSSHDLNHVTEVCKRIVVLENGIIVHDLKKSDTTLEELEKYFAV